MRRASLLGLAFAIPAVLLAADLFGSLGWEQAKFEDTCFKFVQHPDRLPNFPVTPAMRALAVVNRKDAALAIGAKAKAYYASEAFKQRWTEYAAPNAAKEAQEAANSAQTDLQMKQAMDQMEQMLPMLPPAQQEQLKKEIAKAKAKQAKPKSAGGGDSAGPPKDPKVALKQALQTFLTATEGVDYAAATEQRETKKYFTNHAYESKPEAWKMAFRAGREASEGSRGFVKAWLAELK
jgi:hypothetical protein